MLKRIAYITRIPLSIGLLLSIGVLCGWIPALLTQPLVQTIPTLLLTILNAIVFLWVLVAMGITRDRDGLPLLIYILTVTALPVLHTAWQGQLGVLLLLLVLRLLHTAFRQKDTTEDSFLTTLLILIGSLWIPDMVWLVPLVWLSYFFLHSLNLRVFLASVIGMAAFAIYVSLAVYLGWIGNPYASLLSREWILHSVPLGDGIAILCMLGVGIVSLVLSAAGRANDTASRNTLWILLFFFWAVSIGLSLCASAYVSLLPLALLCMSGLLILFFRQEESIARGVAFLVYIALIASAYLLHFFM